MSNYIEVPQFQIILNITNSSQKKLTKHINHQRLHCAKKVIFLLYNYEIQNAFYRLKCKGVKFFSIGSTSLSKNILCTHIGDYSKKQIIVVGGVHSREWITTLLVCKMIEFYKHKKFEGGIYFIPLLNPDGVDICLNGTLNVKDEAIRNQLIEKISNFSQIKCNSNLVDLNVNFPAKWGKGKQNEFFPSAQNFVGYKSASEKEVKALMEFSSLVKPALTISYHSKGEEIYYNFNQSKKKLKSDERFAKLASKLTGYKVRKLKGSVGGYKDWCIQELKIPALTIEVGNDGLSHPLSKKHLPKIFQQNFKCPLLMLENL